MARVGSLGDVVFSVSQNVIKTFQNMQWNGTSRYTTHNRHLRAPIVEFTGRDADTITFNITLSAYLGVNPRFEIRRLTEMQRTGEVLTLVLGKWIIWGGHSRWVIRGLNRGLERFDKDGEMLSMKVAITLLEYPPRKRVRYGPK